MRRVNKTKYFTVFGIVVLIFLIGTIFGYIVSENRIKNFMTTQAEVGRYLLSLGLQSELAEKYICIIDVFELTKEKTELGRKLDFLEKRLGKDNEELLGLKEEYSLLSIRQWILVERVKEKCGTKFTTILFFYSNEENASLSEQQGFILDYLYKKYPESIIIYAFDINIDSPALNTIKEIYSVEYTPSLVVDNKLLPGFHGKEELESLITK